MAYAADLCGSKLRSKLSTVLNESSSEKISSTSFAAKQMAKMGWKEGTGLGKKRDGIVSHIKVKKREDNMGLGVEKERTRQLGVEGMWWSSSVADTLSRLQQKNSSSDGDGGKDKSKSKKKKSKKEKKSKKSKKEKPIAGKIYTDEEIFAATGGARFGTKGGKRAQAKWSRSESSKELKEWEAQVKDKVEWNGLGKANIILSEKNSSKGKKRRRSKEEEEGGKSEEKEEDKIHIVSRSNTPSESTDEASDDAKRRKKKRKSEKKSKKKKTEKK
jgi:Pin2-interacting protein X1